MTGLYLRKYLKDDPSFTPDEGKSDQPFILMRYAEVMLNAAEAAVELALAGEPSPDGSDLMQVATDAVNEIRERAGAELLESNIQPTTEGRNIVRKERRKELAFEHKTKWDLRRWRVWHYEGRDGFWGETRDKNTYSNNASYRFRGLYPFFSTQAGKWFFFRPLPLGIALHPVVQHLGLLLRHPERRGQQELLHRPATEPITVSRNS